jgi:hypothetical protein
MKDALNVVAELAKLELVQLIIVGIVGLIGWSIWVKANRDRQSPSVVPTAPVIPADGNRTATLLDLALFRQEVQIATSERSKEIFERLDDHETRISTLEGARPYKHTPRR